MTVSTVSNKKHDEAERAVNQRKVIVEVFERELENSKETMSQVKCQHNDVMSWADMYSESPIDAKKMTVAQLVSAVRVSKDYKIEIDFKISERQLGLAQEIEVDKKPKQKKE